MVRKKWMLLQKTAEATWDLIGKKIADKMTSAVKQKVKKKKTKQIKGKKSTYQQKKDNKLFMI